MNYEEILNYKLQEDSYKKKNTRKIITNAQFGTSYYDATIFYKHITRLFNPVKSKN